MCPCLCGSMGARRNFRRGERAPKRPRSRRKGPPPPKTKKKVLAPFSEGSEACMLSRENVNSCAPYYILDASQQECI